VSAEHYFSGLLLFMSGTWLATRSSRELASNWRQHRGELCSTGLYSIVRHPLYAGYLVQGAGCMLMLGARWSWIGYAAATGLIIARTFIEDRELAKRFPEDFQEYRKRVKRFIPSVF
jgi:protein-S-isoprenylcysteine O-methyltransferase Ste14